MEIKQKNRFRKWLKWIILNISGLRSYSFSKKNQQNLMYKKILELRDYCWDLCYYVGQGMSVLNTGNQAKYYGFEYQFKM
jgi:hypothetical protein